MQALARIFSRNAVEDMVLLPEISKESILETLRRRFEKKFIYTYIGPVLVSVNPFCSPPESLYSAESRLKYEGRYIHELPPHIYALAGNAFRSMVQEMKDQAIIISGESGSGKTEAAKWIMEIVSGVEKSSEISIRVRNQIIQSNPLLEAFGNAKTLPNDNSSRFGKLVQILYDHSARPVGGRITHFLLEKSRVVRVGTGERNFHIFYQLCAGADLTLRNELSLKDSSEFSILKRSKCLEIRGVNDKEAFDRTQKAMEIVGLTVIDRRLVYKSLAAILHLGNIMFVDCEEGVEKRTEACGIVGDDSISISASLLEVKVESLRHALLHRVLVVGSGEDKREVLVPLSADQARFSRDALAKTLYERLFRWLVNRINSSIAPSKPHDVVNAISVLDIYGFEILRRNSFEQLCINYVNERLHHLFTQCTLKEEQDEYVSEGVEFEPVDFLDNSSCVELIDGKPIGLFALLDEECIMPKATDVTFAQKCVTNFAGLHDHFVRYRMTGDSFGIAHYAGEVQYDVDEFLEKNRDTLHPNIVKVLLHSENSFINSLFAKEKALLRADQRSRSKSTSTVSFKFKRQVDEMIKVLSDSQQHYVRCMKSNNEQSSWKFVDESLSHQILYLGLVESVRMRRFGYVYRRSIHEFCERYKIISKMNDTSDMSDAAREVLATIGVKEGKNFRVGAKKVFIRDPSLVFELDELRERKMHEMACIIQVRYRTWKASQFVSNLQAKLYGMFKGRKERRKCSIGKTFRGIYENEISKADYYRYLGKGQENSAFFCGKVRRFNRRMKREERTMIVAKSFLKLLKHNYRKQITLLRENVTGLSLSPFTDGYFVVHSRTSPDLLLESEMKTEIVSIICGVWYFVGDGHMPVSFEESIPWIIQEKKDERNVMFTNVEDARTTEITSSGKTVKILVAKESVESNPPLEDAKKYGSVYMVNSIHRHPSEKPKKRKEIEGETSRQRGHSVLVGEKISVSVSGKGCVPPKWPAYPRALALYDFDAQGSSELSFKKGETLLLVSTPWGAWWEAVNIEGRRGSIPARYVLVVEAIN